ncbi:MAG: alanine/ornithine racemase family PLP-dependent enzyme [Clostridia bacterium]
MPIIIDLAKFKHNADFLIEKLKKHNCYPAFVTKVFCADKKMVNVLENTDCKYFADSRIENLASYAKSSKTKILLRLPQKSQIKETVKYADISCNSCIEMLSLLNNEAKKQDKKHGVLLMIDLGDLREGVMYDNLEYIDAYYQQVELCSNLFLAGIGANLTCYGSVLPSNDNMNVLANLANRYEEKYHKKLQIVSGGNSSSLLLLEKNMPSKINNLRLGESLILGLETAYSTQIPNMFHDCVRLESEIIEVFEKPSYPIGETSINAFGEKMTYIDKGIMKRAILAIGRQDTICDGLTPDDKNISIVGSSSDHLIVDITNSAKSYAVGDKLTFTANYGAILHLFTSKYIKRKYING